MHDILQQIDRIKTFRSTILDRYAGTPLFGCSLSDVQRVVIINSASRSGSSLLYALLGKLPGVISLTGEAAPFYKLNSRVNAFNPHDSDRIPSELLDQAIDFPGLSRDFLADISPAETEGITRRIDGDRYIDDLMLRLVMQWTDLELDGETLRRCVATAFADYAAGHPIFDTEEFHLCLLERLCRLAPRINPFYYDIGTDKVALRFPFLDIPVGPPTEQFTLEEPPFILLPPKRRPTPEELSGSILLLKSTVDCYRMNLVARLFPGAEIRIIHLVRNPAATINGLYDGWHHRGFFSHNLAVGTPAGAPPPLRIKGYSDRYPFGGSWWNFDLPPGWERFADRDLLEVCAFQWHSANAEILANLETGRESCCRVHFEEIIRSSDSRHAAFERMLQFMGVPAGDAVHLGLDAMPVVQSTLPPQLYRWKKRGEMISRVLALPKIREMAATFGYHDDTREGWL
jgi:hypothetical protein